MLMQPETAMKRLAALPAISKSGKPINGLFRLLSCKELWHQAYEKIANNSGAMTPGVDGQTFDGISLHWLDKIIGTVMSGEYQPIPVRRVYIPKANGKLRPLGVPSVTDRLVQEVVGSILEVIYEPVFSDHSHGFRPKRSCHTALTDIKNVWSGVKWFVEADIKGFFDNLDHKIMMALLAKKIDDKNFLRLIASFLAAGYLEDWKYHNTYSGTPQGGIVSPILSNIYLHELDQFMERWIEERNMGKERKGNPPWISITARIGYIRKKIRTLQERVKDLHHVMHSPEGLEDAKDEIANVMARIVELEAELKEAKIQQFSVPSKVADDPGYRRYRYVRYADDSLIGIIGSKRDAEEMMEAVTRFIETDLLLQVSVEKSAIRHASDGSRFLGYDVRASTPTRMRKHRYPSGAEASKRSSRDRMTLNVPRDKLVAFCKTKGYGDYDAIRATHRSAMLFSSEFEIATQYNSEFRGLAQYYALAGNVKSAMSRLGYIELWSLVKTLAGKHRTSVSEMLNQISKPDGDWTVTSHGSDGSPKLVRIWKLKHLQRPDPKSDRVDSPLMFHFHWARTDMIDRLTANQCAACGKTDRPIEIHHVRKLADHDKSPDFWGYIRASRLRKRVPLCSLCHDDLHAGRLADFRARAIGIESRVQ